MRQALMALLVLGCLSGCANIRQQQAQAAVRVVVESCKSQYLSANPAQTINDRTAMDARDITPSMIANRSLPTAADIEAVKALEPIVRDCQRRISDTMQRYAPVVVPVFEASRITSLEITGAFEEGAMSWGEYNRLKLEAYKLSLLALQKVDMEARAIAAAQRQAAAAEAANAVQALQSVAASLKASQPVFTSCASSGPFTDCLSR